MRRENATTFRPREAGEGDHWSSRSERTVVEGAQDAELRYRCRRITAAELRRLLERKRASLMSAHDDNFLAASRPAPHLGAAEAEDAGGVGIFRRSFRYLIPGNKSPALIAGCLHLLTGANFARGDG